MLWHLMAKRKAHFVRMSPLSWKCGSSPNSSVASRLAVSNKSLSAQVHT